MPAITSTPVGRSPIPDEFLRASHAPPARTLVDLLRSTAEAHPDAPAIDDGSTILEYAELAEAVIAGAYALNDAGVGAGDRVGVRMTSGRSDLYVTILSILAAGAAYVPVDADDPDERAELVFSEAQVTAIVTDEGIGPGTAAPSGTPVVRGPNLDDDAWIIFTSGSTGTPKGVAVTHRNAAAFVDAEARMFCQEAPLGPGDRVLAGLSVAFDASCEEMWLAWRHGACLVPAPRALVRSGMDLGPWLVSRNINVVSTVPTLAAMWPAEASRRCVCSSSGARPATRSRRTSRRSGTRGVEHLRTHRGDRRGLRVADGRHRTGPHRPAPRRMGSRRRGRRRQPRRGGRDR